VFGLEDFLQFCDLDGCHVSGLGATDFIARVFVPKPRSVHFEEISIVNRMLRGFVGKCALLATT
jgi:hypothetical protein